MKEQGLPRIGPKVIAAVLSWAEDSPQDPTFRKTLNEAKASAELNQWILVKGVKMCARSLNGRVQQALTSTA